MIDILKDITIIAGIIFLVLIIFIGSFAGVIFLLRRNDSETKKYGGEGSETKKLKAKYLDFIRHIFGDDVVPRFYIDNCDSKTALISYDGRRFSNKISICVVTYGNSGGGFRVCLILSS